MLTAPVNTHIKTNTKVILSAIFASTATILSNFWLSFLSEIISLILTGISIYLIFNVLAIPEIIIKNPKKSIKNLYFKQTQFLGIISSIFFIISYLVVKILIQMLSEPNWTLQGFLLLINTLMLLLFYLIFLNLKKITSYDNFVIQLNNEEKDKYLRLTNLTFCIVVAMSIGGMTIISVILFLFSMIILIKLYITKKRVSRNKKSFEIKKRIGEFTIIGTAYPHEIEFKYGTSYGILLIITSLPLMISSRFGELITGNIWRTVILLLFSIPLILVFRNILEFYEILKFKKKTEKYMFYIFLILPIPIILISIISPYSLPIIDYYSKSGLHSKEDLKAISIQLSYFFSYFPLILGYTIFSAVKALEDENLNEFVKQLIWPLWSRVSFLIITGFLIRVFIDKRIEEIPIAILLGFSISSFFSILILYSVLIGLRDIERFYNKDTIFTRQIIFSKEPAAHQIIFGGFAGTIILFFIIIMYKLDPFAISIGLIISSYLCIYLSLKNSKIRILKASVISGFVGGLAILLMLLIPTFLNGIFSIKVFIYGLLFCSSTILGGTIAAFVLNNSKKSK